MAELICALLAEDKNPLLQSQFESQHVFAKSTLKQVNTTQFLMLIEHLG